MDFRLSCYLTSSIIEREIRRNKNAIQPSAEIKNLTLDSRLAAEVPRKQNRDER